MIQAHLPALPPQRLEHGRLTWPQAKDGVVSLTPAQLSMLLEDIDRHMPMPSWQPEMLGSPSSKLYTPALTRHDGVIAIDLSTLPDEVRALIASQSATILRQQAGLDGRSMIPLLLSAYRPVEDEPVFNASRRCSIPATTLPESLAR